MSFRPQFSQLVKNFPQFCDGQQEKIPHVRGAKHSKNTSYTLSFGHAHKAAWSRSIVPVMHWLRVLSHYWRTSLTHSQVVAVYTLKNLVLYKHKLVSKTTQALCPILTTQPFVESTQGCVGQISTQACVKLTQAHVLPYHKLVWCFSLLKHKLLCICSLLLHKLVLP